MVDRDGEPADESVDAVMDDFEDPSAEVETYERDDCGHRMEAEHQPGQCPECGGAMVDISVSRE